ncbi:uncharacterized protein [Primulina huaijiensis]|uniref:uncharacterized protein isoform X6 n=1 Tax=Primulina huaijiensis TaxID=1492673 RepID=UPI003CC70253
MIHPGAGAEAHARFNRYGYRANSSRVFTTDPSPSRCPRANREAKVGVAVEFEESEEEDKESNLDMIPEDDEEECDVAGALRMGGGIDDYGKQRTDEGLNLNVQDKSLLRCTILSSFALLRA